MEENVIVIRESLSRAICMLQDIRDKVSEDDPSRFCVKIKQDRALEPIREISSQDVLGFKQASASVLTIIVEDNALKGKLA